MTTTNNLKMALIETACVVVPRVWALPPLQQMSIAQILRLIRGF